MYLHRGQFRTVHHGTLQTAVSEPMAEFVPHYDLDRGHGRHRNYLAFEVVGVMTMRMIVTCGSYAVSIRLDVPYTHLDGHWLPLALHHLRCSMELP